MVAKIHGTVRQITKISAKRPKARSIRMQCTDALIDQASRRANSHTLIASPPIVEGRVWLKNIPIIVNFQLAENGTPVPKWAVRSRRRAAATTPRTSIAAKQINATDRDNCPARSRSRDRSIPLNIHQKIDAVINNFASKVRRVRVFAFKVGPLHHVGSLLRLFADTQTTAKKCRIILCVVKCCDWRVVKNCGWNSSIILNSPCATGLRYARLFASIAATMKSVSDCVQRPPMPLVP